MYLVGQAWEALGEGQPHYPGEIRDQAKCHELEFGDLFMALAVNTSDEFGPCPMGFLSGGRLNFDAG